MQIFYNIYLLTQIIRKITFSSYEKHKAIFIDIYCKCDIYKL